MIIAVGSTNPSKLQPVKEVFSFYFKDVNIVGCNVDSGVRSQPLSNDEMFQGALQRAKLSLQTTPKAEYGVGIEGGLHHYSYGWFEQSLGIIVNQEGTYGVGSSGGLLLPDKVMKAIDKGKTLEEAVDGLCGTKQIGKGIGMFGVFTNGYVTRSSGISHSLAFALARFLHHELY